METYSILKIGLIVHLTGIVMMIGMLIAGFIGYSQIWKRKVTYAPVNAALLQWVNDLRTIQMIGALLIIAGGLTMMIALHGAPMHTLWFKIKLFLLSALLLNMVVTGRLATAKLKIVLMALIGNKQLQYDGLRSARIQLITFYIIQTALILAIFTVSAFQFN